MTTEHAAAVAISPADGITLQRLARAGGYAGPLPDWRSQGRIPGRASSRRVPRATATPEHLDGHPGPATCGCPSAARRQRAGTRRSAMTASWAPASWKGLRDASLHWEFGYAVSQSTASRGTGHEHGRSQVRWRASAASLRRPYDGVLGPNSWKGVQTVLTGAGYTATHRRRRPDANTLEGAAAHRAARSVLCTRGAASSGVTPAPEHLRAAELGRSSLLRSEHD